MALHFVCGCAGWSAPLLFANTKDRFSRVEAQICKSILYETTHLVPLGRCICRSKERSHMGQHMQCWYLLLKRRFGRNCANAQSRLMPQSHTHLRTLRMIRKARPQLSAHSVTIRITSAENVIVRILSATNRKALSIRAQILKNIKKVLRMKTTQ